MRKCLAPVIMTLAVLFLVQGAEAQVTLKKKFFSGWNYSANGSDYKKVGIGAKDLSGILYECDSCMDALSSYKSSMTAAAITGYPGGFILGWPIGASIGGAEWTDTYTAMAIGGGALSLVSIILETSASGSLKTAVRRYNGAHSLTDKSTPGEGITFGFSGQRAYVALRW